ncbi:MAG: hypothetical protein LH479_03520 [Polaromonas sp.]|nr:hypothetical protein [Polaromonas sp.]
MLQNFGYQHIDAPDFVQSGRLSHTFGGQEFKPAPRSPIQRIRSLWPFPVEKSQMDRSGDGEDHTPSSFTT